ncbi:MULTISPECIES: hypothetical protein [Cytobacillus]|uniref:hypothetical protein n=1 Tax=Cytobacillus TaxID=2675230 RepID=UPI0013595F3D|nr:hypothetical protein [Cytobacillus firmus]KAF0819567.1 hypothetical protein KIS4809_1428 [Bacillus sp. ZZV12-4809]MCM3705679.1 hypothetical protein [Cytobacillus firmus]
MEIVGIITFLSLSLLLMSLLLIYSKFHHQTPGKLAGIILFFLLTALPLVYIVNTEQSMNYASNYFTLGSAFMFVWVVTTVLLLFGILFRFRSGEEDSFY